MDSFSTEKGVVLSALGNPDRSKKGMVDEQAWPLINAINSLEEYYTTSSCSGRITVFLEPKSGKKHDAQWLYSSHDRAHVEEVLSAVNNPPEELLWFRMESPIFHVACKDLSAAERLVQVCQRNGWKRSGIISLGGRRLRQSRVMVEIIGHDRIDVPISENHRLLVSKEYLDFLVRKANLRLKKSHQRIEELRKKIELLTSPTSSLRLLRTQ